MISILVRRTVPFVSRAFCSDVPFPIRKLKPKSNNKVAKHFVDAKTIRAIAGKGGDGCISLLQLYLNDSAGTDGGDGGNGGHVLLQASSNVKDLDHVKKILSAEDGEKGSNKDCHGKNASHLVIQVPVGTIVKAVDGRHIGDLDKEGSMFVLARGGAGGKGNAYFATATQQTPIIAEYGAKGEEKSYLLEVKSMANFGLVGFPNAGKSTLLQAISRAKPKVASYPFTTLKPYVGIVEYSDYEQLAVADLPGLISGSHRNHGLGIQFLRHLERCSCLLFILDISKEPCSTLEILKYELEMYDSSLLKRPYIIIANKIDIPSFEGNLEELKKIEGEDKVIAISAKFGKNVTKLLHVMRKIHDQEKERKKAIG